MHPKTPKWLQDVLDACDLSVRACEGHTRESFTQNELLKGAVERKFEIIGEALSRISSLFRYSVEKLSTTLSDNLAMSTDLTFHQRAGQ